MPSWRACGLQPGIWVGSQTNEERRTQPAELELISQKKEEPSQKDKDTRPQGPRARLTGLSLLVSQVEGFPGQGVRRKGGGEG